MENSNEQSQSYIINLLVRYGSLNSIYNEVFENGKLTVFQQKKIYNFYNDFKDVEIFEAGLLSFFYVDNQTKNLNLLNQLKSRIQSNISLYDGNLLFVNEINVYEVCYFYVEDLYKDRIKLMSDCVWKYKKMRRELDRDLEPSFFEPLSKEKEAGIWIELKRLEVLEKKAQEELDVIYNESNTERREIFKYKKNVFKNIQELGLRFISIINNYFLEEKEVVAEESLMDPKPVEHFEKKENIKAFKHIKIKESELFMPNMFIKLLKLEKLLLKEGLLDENLKWNLDHVDDITGLRLLIIFLDRLDTNNYFMNKKSDSKKRRFFEFRYSVKIGQNFEKNKRNRYLDKYLGVYSDYPF